jgi:hypothetical protein
MAITLEQAKCLGFGDILYSVTIRNKQGEYKKWKVNGKVKTWVRDPERIYVPLKHGLYQYDRLTEYDLGLVSLQDPKTL